ncbi:phosphate regulon sensor histidine kinase PhoR [Neisseriaceae bacterium ESL0693]|nr:phosphate regulon sensor histidine kinase PhoR [Neisseriaceae bacterium ESL0693]
MTELYRHYALILASVMVIAVLAGLMGGWLWFTSSLCLALLYWLVVYWWHLAKLMRWLERPKLRNAPQGLGIWHTIFSVLIAQARSRKKRKQKLGVALARFNRIAETIPDGVLVLGSDGRIQWLNHLAAEHLNLDPVHDRNALLSEVIDQHALQQLVSSNSSEINTVQISMTTPQGLPRVLNIIRTPFEAQATLLISEDITAAEQLNATRTAFVANVSHELRTPLTVINGFLETLAEFTDLPKAQQQEFIGLMHKESQRMNQLLTDLLTLSRLENQAVTKVIRKPVNLSELVYQLVAEAENVSKQRHHFKIDIEPDVWIKGMAEDVYSALSNLVFNAVRYTPEEGWICLSLHSKPDQPDWVQFTVQDTGPGIAPEHLPHLTERFYRVDAGRSRQNGGTGLGLAIAKHALAEHGGCLSIESQLGKGSIFTASIPKWLGESVIEETFSVKSHNDIAVLDK